MENTHFAKTPSLSHVWSVLKHIRQISINWPNLRGTVPTPIKGM